MSLANSSLSGIFYARSKQPKWRDASGQTVESKIDLGRMGFLRGERNWVILLTSGEPVILRIEDSALRTVLPALQERTGQKYSNAKLNRRRSGSVKAKCEVLAIATSDFHFRLHTSASTSTSHRLPVFPRFRPTHTSIRSTAASLSDRSEIPWKPPNAPKLVITL